MTNIYNDADPDRWNEDLPELFEFTFKAKNHHLENTQVEQFEKIHPNLTLVDVHSFDTNVPVMTGPVLFTDGTQAYRELKYTFTVYQSARVYQPSNELLEWLGMMDEFSEYRKEKYILKLKQYWRNK